MFRQLAYFIWLNESIARLASNCATLKRLLRGPITERVPRWSADTCPYWALRDVRGCAELERALKQRDALTASNVVVLPPGQVGGRISNQPGAVVDLAAAAEVDARNPGLDRVSNAAGQAQRHPPHVRGQLSSQPGAVVDGAAAAKVDARNPGLDRVFDVTGRAQRHPPHVRGQLGGEVAQTRRSLSLSLSLSLTVVSLSHQPTSCRAPLSLSSFSHYPLSLLLSRRT